MPLAPVILLPPAAQGLLPLALSLLRWPVERNFICISFIFLLHLDLSPLIFLGAASRCPWVGFSAPSQPQSRSGEQDAVCSSLLQHRRARASREARQGPASWLLLLLAAWWRLPSKVLLSVLPLQRSPAMRR